MSQFATISSMPRPSVTSNVLPVSGDGWMDEGHCRGRDQSIFYPDDHAGRNAYKRARVICATCPVSLRCLQFALANMHSDPDDETDIPIGAHGMWGGTTPRERWRMLGKAWAA